MEVTIGRHDKKVIFGFGVRCEMSGKRMHLDDDNIKEEPGDKFYILNCPDLDCPVTRISVTPVKKDKVI